MSRTSLRQLAVQLNADPSDVWIAAVLVGVIMEPCITSLGQVDKILSNEDVARVTAAYNAAAANNVIARLGGTAEPEFTIEQALGEEDQ